MGSTSAKGQVEHGSRPEISVGSSGCISSAVEVVRAPPRSETVVKRGSHDETDFNPEIITRNLDKKVANEGVVELGSHCVAPTENLRPRTAGVRPVGPLPDDERTDGRNHARISKGRLST